MKKPLDLFRALVALVAFGNAASHSLQTPYQTQQIASGGPHRGLSSRRNLAGGPGGSFGEGPAGLSSESLGYRSSGNIGPTPGLRFGTGGGAGSSTGYPSGLGGSLPASGPGGRESDGSLGRLGRGSQDAVGLSSATFGGVGNGLGAAGRVPESGLGSGGSVPGQGRPGTGITRGQLSGSLGPGRLPGLEGERPLSPDFGNGPATFGGGNMAGGPLSGSPGEFLRQGLGAPSILSGPQSTAGMGGNSLGGGPSSTQPSGSEPLSSLGSEAGPGISGVPSSGSGTGPGSFVGGSPNQAGSNGPGARGSAAGPGGARAGTGLTSRRPSTQPGRHPKKLRPEDAAAIGLGVASSALALGAIAAGIFSAVNQRNQGKLRARARPAGAAGASKAAGRQGCASNSGRRQRSVAESKVPAEVLDSIPMNFEHLY